MAYRWNSLSQGQVPTGNGGLSDPRGLRKIWASLRKKNHRIQIPPMTLVHPSRQMQADSEAQPEAQAWMQKSQPVGPACEWPRWKGGDPAERWPSSSDWPLNR